MTVEEIAKKYGMTLAKDVVLGKMLQEILIRLDNLETDMAIIMGHKKEEEAESFTKRFIEMIKEDK